jgi:hypothetical protein
LKNPASSNRLESRNTTRAYHDRKCFELLESEGAPEPV